MLATAIARVPGHAIPTALLATAALPVLHGRQLRPATVAELPRRHRGLQTTRAVPEAGLLGLHSKYQSFRR